MKRVIAQSAADPFNGSTKILRRNCSFFAFCVIDILRQLATNPGLIRQPALSVAICPTPGNFMLDNGLNNKSLIPLPGRSSFPS